MPRYVAFWGSTRAALGPGLGVGFDAETGMPATTEERLARLVGWMGAELSELLTRRCRAIWTRLYALYALRPTGAGSGPRC